MMRRFRTLAATVAIGLGSIVACSDSSDPVGSSDRELPQSVAPDASYQGTPSGTVPFSLHATATPAEGTAIDSIWIDLSQDGQQQSGEVGTGNAHTVQGVVENFTDQPQEYCFTARAYQNNGRNKAAETCFEVLAPEVVSGLEFHLRDFDDAYFLPDRTVRTQRGANADADIHFPNGNVVYVREGRGTLTEEHDVREGNYRVLITSEGRPDQSVKIGVRDPAAYQEPLSLLTAPQWTREEHGFDWREVEVFMHENFPNARPGEAILVAKTPPVSVWIDDGPVHKLDPQNNSYRIDESEIGSDSAQALRMTEEEREWTRSIAQEDMASYLPQCEVEVYVRSEFSDVSNFPADWRQVPEGGIWVARVIGAPFPITQLSSRPEYRAERSFVVFNPEYPRSRANIAADMHESTGLEHLWTRGEDRASEVEHINRFLDYYVVDDIGARMGTGKPLDAQLRLAQLHYPVAHAFPGSGKRYVHVGHLDEERLVPFYINNDTKPILPGKPFVTQETCE